MDERRAQANLRRRIERLEATSKPGVPASPGKSVAETCILAKRCPVYRRRESYPGSCTEPVWRCQGKRHKRLIREAEIPTGQAGADSSVVVLKWGNAHGAKGGGHPRWSDGPTGDRRSPPISTEGGSLRWMARAG